MEEVKEIYKLSEKLSDAEVDLYNVASLIRVIKEYAFEKENAQDPKEVIGDIFCSLEIAHKKLNAIVQHLTEDIRPELEEMEAKILHK